MHLAPAILLSSAERATLTAWAHAKSLPLRVIQRAQIVAMAADGVTSQDIAEQLEISRPTVQRRRERFLALRVTGLEKDAPRPGRIPSIPATKIRVIVEATLHTKPPAATHWSTRTMAHAHGVSEATVRRIWKLRVEAKPPVGRSIRPDHRDPMLDPDWLFRMDRPENGRVRASCFGGYIERTITTWA